MSVRSSGCRTALWRRFTIWYTWRGITSVCSTKHLTSIVPNSFLLQIMLNFIKQYLVIPFRTLLLIKGKFQLELMRFSNLRTKQGFQHGLGKWFSLMHKTGLPVGKVPIKIVIMQTNHSQILDFCDSFVSFSEFYAIINNPKDLPSAKRSPCTSYHLRFKELNFPF